MARVPLFLVALLVVRGLPALLYRPLFRRGPVVAAGPHVASGKKPKSQTGNIIAFAVGLVAILLGTFLARTAKLGDGLVNFLTDVTEQRRIEAELGNYADVVAHDLSEPIAGIAMLVGLLERRPEQPPPPEVLRQLRASSERARDLIDGVLLYARAGELSIERVALGELVTEVAADLRPSLERAGATLEIGRLPEVEADPRQLRRVLQNLLANALKFRADAPTRIELSALRDSEEWVVTVRDNGLGVRPDQTSRIFGMFSRANREVEGAGIGLAVCRRIVEAHGGRIWVEPAAGGGSAFRFTLPR